MEIGTKAQNLRAARIIYANPATLTGEMEGGIKIIMLRVAFTHAAASAASDDSPTRVPQDFSRLSVSALEVEA